MSIRRHTLHRSSGLLLGASLLMSTLTASAEEPAGVTPVPELASKIEQIVEPVIPGAPIATWPSALAVVERGGGRVVGNFDAGHGLQGWYVQKGINVQVVYTTLDGDLLIVGALVDPNGDNLTQEQMGVAYEFADFSSIWQGLASANAVSFGPARSELYIVFEPHCHYCHLIWNTIKGMKGASFNLLPVAFRRDSLYLSAALLQEKDRVKVVETYFDPQASAKLAAKYSESSGDVLDKVQANIDFMKNVDINGTPALIWKDHDGKVRFRTGALGPDELKEILAAATR